MQLNLLNLLLNVPGGAGSTALSADAGTNGGVFSQLLGGESDFTTGQLPKDATGGALFSELAPSALVAQEVSFTNAQATLNQDITPEDASALIGKIDGLLTRGQGNSGQQQTWQQLKAALQSVADGDKSVKLAQVVEDVPDLNTLQDVADGDVNATPLMRMLAWVQQALEKKKETAAAADAEEGVSAIAALSSGLQAGMFRPDAGQAAAEDAAKAQEAIAAVATDDAIANRQPTPPAWQDGSKDTENGEAIPSLALSGDDALPVITLPQVASHEDDLQQAAAAETKAASRESSAAASTREWQAKTESWLKSLPFPLKLSDASGSEMQIGSDEEASGLSPLPSNGTTKDSRLSSTLTDSIGGSKQANTNDTGSLIVSAAPPATYTASNPSQQVGTTYTPMVHTPPAEQVHVAIRNAAKDGIDHITIQLDPADLGRVEINMSVAHDGRTHMVFTADKSSTLDMLSRDAYGLERSLADSGIKADSGTMEFNLRQHAQFVQPDAGGNSGSGNGQPMPREEHSENTIIAPLTAEPARYVTLNVSGGVDIQA